MAFTGITATEADIDLLTGKNVSTDFTDTMKTLVLLWAEGWLNSETEFNWSDNFAALNTDVKGIVTSVTAGLVALRGIGYDPSGYTTEGEGQFKGDLINDDIQRGTKTLRIKSKQGFITGA